MPTSPLLDRVRTEAARIATTPPGLPDPDFEALARHVLRQLAGYPETHPAGIRQQDVTYLARTLEAVWRVGGDQTLQDHDGL